MFFKFNASVLPKITYLGFVSLKDNWKHFHRKVEEYIFYYVVYGEMYIREGDNKYHLKKGDCFILEPNIEHEGYKTSNCDFYYVHFKYENNIMGFKKIDNKLKDNIISNRKDSYQYETEIYFDIFESKITFVPKLYNIYNPIKFEALKKHLDTAIDEYLHKYENYKVIASTIFLTVLLSIHRDFVTYDIEKQKIGNTRTHSVINNVIKYINMNVYKKFKREDFEEEFELNYDYLNRQFKKFTGHTIGKYMLMQKINRSITLMKSSNFKISQIAYIVGIDDPYYFSKVFKKQTGLSPTEYKNAANIQDPRSIDQNEKDNNE